MPIVAQRPCHIRHHLKQNAFPPVLLYLGNPKHMTEYYYVNKISYFKKSVTYMQSSTYQGVHSECLMQCVEEGICFVSMSFEVYQLSHATSEVNQCLMAVTSLQGLVASCDPVEHQHIQDWVMSGTYHLTGGKP